MIRAASVFPADRWSRVAADTVVLDFDQRHRRRLAMTGERGVAFLLDLPDAVALREGDGLLLEDGRMIAVKAAPEPLAEIAAADSLELMRIAWHLGNRHLPAQLMADRIRIRRDRVIEEMVRGLGGSVKHVEAPFDPEGGAYHHHHGDRGHDHEHSHG